MTSLEDLENELRATNQRLRAVVRETRQLAIEKQGLENNISILIQLAEAEITEYEQRINIVENQEQISRERAGRLINDLGEERRKNSLLRVNVINLNEQINANQEQNNLLRNQRNIFQNRYQQRQISVNNLESENNSQQAQIQQLQSRINHQQQGINRLRTQKNNYYDLNNRLNEEVDHLNQESAILQQELFQASNKLEDLNNEISSLRGQNTYWQFQDDQLRNTIIDLQNQINNHTCPPTPTHTCSPCSLIHLPEEQCLSAGGMLS